MKITLSLILSFFALLVIGQNCSPIHKGGGLLKQNTTGTTLPLESYVLDDSVPLYSRYPKESFAKDFDLIFFINASDFEQEGLERFFWDHSRDGGVFCNQKDVEGDPYSVIINCAQTGPLNLIFIAEYANGQVLTFEAEVEILADAKPPVEPVNPTPPQPTPQSSGRELYQVNCQGCHAVGSKSGRSAMSIQRAINNNVGGMGSLNFLTPDEVQRIADYLAQ